MIPGVTFVKIENDYWHYSVAHAYTANSIFTILADNELVSVLAEYDNTGELLQIHVDTDINVKEIK